MNAETERRGEEFFDRFKVRCRDSGAQRDPEARLEE